MWLQSHVTKVFSWRHSCFQLTSLVIVVTRCHYYFFNFFFFLLATSFFFCHISHSDGIMYQKSHNTHSSDAHCGMRVAETAAHFFSKYNTDHARLFFCYSIFFSILGLFGSRSIRPWDGGWAGSSAYFLLVLCLWRRAAEDWETFVSSTFLYFFGFLSLF